VTSSRGGIGKRAYQAAAITSGGRGRETTVQQESHPRTGNTEKKRKETTSKENLGLTGAVSWRTKTKRSEENHESSKVT